ncbi:hypothetical protein [uncultured Aquimarina sp.]|uniref:hypothetical protein n=1 Tax=uncultured Aquimarina sp. TaxID=575652 RepID=UPI0026160C12|nr:hypothetical protein [uncultured Aquimarina sp.]
MKQIFTYSLLIFLCSCKTDQKNSKAVESLQNELEKMEEKGKEMQEKLEQNDSIISEIQMVIENSTDSIAEKKVNTQPNCEITTLIKIDSLIKQNIELNDQNFAVFFANINPKCSNNIEYSEFNNELIFKTLKSNPKKFVVFLSRVSKKKEILEFVLTQLRNPINDGIELNKISKKLDKTETEDLNTQKLILESLKKAIEKYN